MVIADFSGDYLNTENAKENDIAEIIEEGSYADIESNGKTRTILNIPVSINEKKKTYSPTKETGKKFVKEWGADTALWKGKKFQIKYVHYKSFGVTKIAIEGEPIAI